MMFLRFNHNQFFREVFERDLRGSKMGVIERACRLIEESEVELRLNDLAEKLEISPYQLHRQFKEKLGITPKHYARGLREDRMRRELESGKSVTEAIYEAGYQSGSRFYEKSEKILGMHAKKYRQGGEGQRIRFAIGQCSLGAILVAQSERGICAISLGDDPDQLVVAFQDRFAKACIEAGDEDFEQLVAHVVGFVENPHLGWALPLDIRGTAFQQRVWLALRQIPAGQTLSYSELAEKIGQPRAIRAVASACAANQLAVAIPCHRILRVDGQLSGYRWGVDRKRALLLREQAN